MIIAQNKKWAIMSKDRKLIAKGATQNRHIVHVDEKDKKRLLTYRGKKSAENGFTISGFYVSRKALEHLKQTYGKDKEYGWNEVLREEVLEAVEVLETLELLEVTE